MKKTVIILLSSCLIFWTLFSTGCINFWSNDKKTPEYDDNNSNYGTSKFDLQVMYFPEEYQSIDLSELSLDNDSIQNVTNDTFSIIIECSEVNKRVEYNLTLQDDSLIVNFNEDTLTPRLEIGFIEENKNYTIDFIFKINSDDPDITSLNVWGDINIVSVNVWYDHNNGLFLDFLKGYKNVSWSYGKLADIILSFPYNQKFAIYLGIMEDY